MLSRSKIHLIVISAFLLTFAVSILGRAVFAQDTPKNPLEIAFEAYQISLEEYTKTHEVYVVQRSRYLRFKTLQSKQDAYNATLAMLLARDEVLIKYIELLKKRLDDSIGIPQTRVEGLKFLLTERSDWFTEHKQIMQTSATLEDLVKDSDDAKKEFQESETLFYETMLTATQGRVSDFTDRANELNLRITGRVGEIRSDTREGYSFSSAKFQTLDRWLFEANNRILRSREAQIEAEDEISKLARRRASLGEYELTMSLFGQSQLYLSESSNFLKEVIREIKTAEN